MLLVVIEYSRLCGSCHGELDLVVTKVIIKFELNEEDSYMSDADIYSELHKITIRG